MAFLPSPIKHDLFLSYAHEDAVWVNALREQVADELINRLGPECSIWQDENEIRTGQNWPNALETAIKASAAFLAIISRNYQNSDWCERELDAFLSEADAQNSLEAGGYGRVLKVIKFPWLNDDHRGFLHKYQHVSFYERDAKAGQEKEFKHTSESFRKAVKTLAYHIEKLFEAMLRAREKVFVARTAEDVSTERASIIREIRAAGYALSPPPLGAVAKRLDRETLLRYIAEARVSVHILGASSDPDTRRQIDLALEAEKKVVFCLVRGHEAATGDQKLLMEEIRNNNRNLPEGTWALLESRSQAVLRQDLIGLLTPRPAPAPAANQAARVYLMCDPNSPEDSAFAREVQNQIRAKERFDVDLQQAATDSGSPALRHEQLICECNGLLLYFDKASPSWYKRNFVDILMAEERAGRRRELRSKALLVGDANVASPGLTVLQRRDPFHIEQLEPFLAALRSPAAEKGGGAYAGR